MAKQLKNIILDCSETVLDFYSKDYLAKYLDDKERAYNIHYTIFRSDAWKQYDYGYLNDEQLQNAVVPLLDEKDRDAAVHYLSCWTDKYRVTEGMTELVSELKQKGYRIYMLSNFPARFELLWKRFDIFRMFDGRAVSYEAHLSKGGEMGLFDYIINKYSLDRDECVFIDDHQSLVDNAEKKGIRGIHFTNVNNLRLELEKIIKGE